MEKQQEEERTDSMDVDDENSVDNNDEVAIDNSKSNEKQSKGQRQRGVRQKNLRGLAKTDAEIVPNNTGKKQGFVAYTVTYGKPRFDF